MLRNSSKPWCWGLALLVVLGPAVVLACSPEDPTSWKKQSPDGRFELSLEAAKDSYSGPFPLSLREVSTRKVLWQRTLDSYVSSSAMFISPSGRYVAIASTFGETVGLLGPDGSESGQWSIKAQLKPSELRRIPYSSCGEMWLGERRFEGDVLVLEVLTGGTVPPMYKQPKGTLMRIDARTGKLTREEPPPEKSTAELIQASRSASDEPSRRESIDALLGRSEDVGIGGDAGLSRFWQELLTASGTSPELLTAGVEGLGLVATDEELRKVARLPKGAPERNEALLQVLERRLPDQAEAYALRVLSERWPTELLRTRAAVFLASRKGAVAERGLELALSDPSAKVRESALSSLADVAVAATAIEQALSFCADPDADVRSRAVESLRRVLRDARKEEHPAAMAVLRRAGTTSGLKCFPEGWIILGGVADLQSDRAGALELYTRGLKELEGFEPERRNHSRDLVLEATLQLALEAQKQGKRSEVERRAREVLADKRSRHEYVCAPRANIYAGETGGRGCQGRLRASAVAEKLLEQAKE